MFRDKILVITGGTGSFGNAVLEHFLQSDLAEIRIFSRDEKKQEEPTKVEEPKKADEKPADSRPNAN
jgi:UDP-glucose 4-epimerase